MLDSTKICMSDGQLLMLLQQLSRTGNTRGIMVVVEPTPGRDTTKVIMHDPLQSLDIAINQSIHLLRVIVVDLEFALNG